MEELGNLWGNFPPPPLADPGEMQALRANIDALTDTLLKKQDPNSALEQLDKMLPLMEIRLSKLAGTPWETSARNLVNLLYTVRAALQKGNISQAELQLNEIIKQAAPDPQGALAEMEVIGALAQAVHTALVEKNDPNTALALLNDGMPQVENWPKKLQGTAAYPAAVQMVGYARLIHQALQAGKVEKAKALMVGLGAIGSRMEETIRRGAKIKNPLPAASPASNPTGN